MKNVNKIKKNKNGNYPEKYRSKTHNKNFEHNHYNDHKPSGDNSIAVKKRRITSYYVSNIDPYVSENDIAQYLTDSGVRLTFIKMFHGKYGSAAKVNIPDNFPYIVESDDFWPEEIIVRRWKVQSEWDRHHADKRYTKSENRYRGRNTYSHKNKRFLGNNYRPADYTLDDEYETDDFVNRSGNLFWNEQDDWNDGVEDWPNC